MIIIAVQSLKQKEILYQYWKHMNFSTKKALTLLVLLSLCLQTTSTYCRICDRCNSCSTEVISDIYLDKIHSLLKQKFTQVQYPISIKKYIINLTNTDYQIQYDNNFAINLTLDIQTGKITILGYANNNQPLLLQISDQCAKKCPSQKLNGVNDNIPDQKANNSNIKASNTSNTFTKSIQNSQQIASYMGTIFSTIKDYVFSNQGQLLINSFLCRRFFSQLSSNSIKLLSFKSYGIFSRLVYFVNYGGQIKVFQIIVSADNNNNRISVVSYTQITKLIRVQGKVVYYNAEKLTDFTYNNSSSLNNSAIKSNANISIQNTSSISANKRVSSSNQISSQPLNSKFYKQITDLKGAQLKQLQGYLSSIFYKTYIRLNLIKAQSQFILKQVSPAKEFTSYRLTFKVQKYQNLYETQPLFYQILVKKSVTPSLTLYDVISAMYINLLSLKQVQEKLQSRSLTSSDAKIDQNLPFIDAIIVKEFEAQLGNSPSVTRIRRHEPYYQLIYTDLQNNSTQFLILYDVLLDNIQFYKNNNQGSTQINEDTYNKNKTLNVIQNANGIQNGSIGAKNTQSATKTISSPLKPEQNESFGKSPGISSSKAGSNNYSNSYKLADSANSETKSSQGQTNFASEDYSSSQEYSSIIYLSGLVNNKSGIISVPKNVSSLVNYSRFLQIQDYAGNPNAVGLVNYLVQFYCASINYFMRVSAVFNYQSIYRFVFQIRRFQNSDAEPLLYQIILSASTNAVTIFSTQYVNDYVHQLDPTILTQKLCLDSSNLDNDLYMPNINQLLLTSILVLPNQNISVKSLLEGAFLKTVGRYLPFYVLSYSNGVGIIVFYDVVNKKIQVLFVNKITQSSAVLIQQRKAPHQSQNINLNSNDNVLSSNHIQQNLNVSNKQIKNSLSSSRDQIQIFPAQQTQHTQETKQTKQTQQTQQQTQKIQQLKVLKTGQNKQSSFTFNNISHSSALQIVPTLSLNQLSTGTSVPFSNSITNSVKETSQINSSQYYQKNKSRPNLSTDLIDRQLNRSNQSIPPSHKQEIIVKQIGISFLQLSVQSLIVTQIGSQFWKKVNQFLANKKIINSIRITKNLLDYSRLETIDQSQPLYLAFKTSTSNPYFSKKSDGTDYSLLSKLMTFQLVKQNNLNASQINSINFQVILQNIFENYKRFVLMNGNAQTVYEVIVNNQFFLLSFRQIKSLQQLTSDPYSSQFNISLQFSSQMQRFQNLKTYSDIISQIISVQIDFFKEIKLNLAPLGYKFTFSYLSNLTKESELLWFVTELFINVRLQQIQFISHKRVPPLPKLQLNKIYSNLKISQSNLSQSQLSQQGKQNLYSIVDMLIQKENSMIFQKNLWIISVLQLYTILNDPKFMAFFIKYKNNQTLAQFAFQGKYNLQHKYIVMTGITKTNQGFNIASYSDNLIKPSKNLLNRLNQISASISNKSQYNPVLIETKFLTEGRSIYVFLYNNPVLYQIAFTDSQPQFFTVNYLGGIQTGQYFQELGLAGFDQIRLPQTRFYQAYNQIMSKSFDQFPQLSKSTILAVYFQDSYEILTYRSIYQYAYQTLVFETNINKTNYKATSRYNKDIKIAFSGYYTRNCKVQSIQNRCTACNNSSGDNFLLSNGRCYQLISNCKNQIAYKCYSCADHYELINNVCADTFIVALSVIDSTNYLGLDYSGQSSNCIAFDSFTSKCTKCQSRFYLSSIGECKIIQVQCDSYDQNIGKCSSCKPGFKLNASSICYKDQRICKVFDSNGQCCQCPGVQMYVLFNGICYLARLNSTDGSVPQRIQSYIRSDVLCSKWSMNKCYECVSGAALNVRGICQISSLNCVSFDYNRQLCSACVRQFSNLNGRCVRSN